MVTTLQPVSVPGFESHSSSEDLTTPASSIMKVGRYLVLTAIYLLPGLSPNAQVSMGTLQHSLNSGAAVETILSADTVAAELREGMEEYQNTNKVALTLIKRGAYATTKADSLLWALDNFGVPNDLFTNAFHGVGYLASLGLAVKNCLEAAETVEGIEDTAHQEKLSLLKRTKFAFSALAAAVGFLSLIYTAKLVVLAWVGFSLVGTLLSIGDYFYEKSLKPESIDDTHIRSRLTPPKPLALI